MQIELKLRVASVALLLSLVAIASPAESQVPAECTPLQGQLPLFGTGPTPECTDALTGSVSPDALCALNEEATDPTFPGCLQEMAPPADLNALCAVNPESADPTFPGCLQDIGTPDVLPEGCDPSDPPTCAPVPPADLDALCALNPESADPTFPGCLEDFSPPADLNALCAVNPESADPTFPGCLQDIGTPDVLPEGCDPSDPPTCVPAVDTGALDALCALNPESADPTFPGCLQDVSPPDVLPEGCDPSDPPTCVPAVDPSVLDALCAVLNAAAADPTFPACVLELVPGGEDPNTPPTVSAGTDFTVDEGTVANLDGTASDSDGDTLTFSWACVPAQTLGSATSLDTSFTAPTVSADEVVTCTLTADDGTDQVSDSVAVTVNDVPVITPTLVFVLDSLASQGVDNAVLVTGTVTSNVDLADAAIAIEQDAAANAGLAGSGAENIVWADGDVDTIGLAADSPEAFEAIVEWSDFEEVAWVISVASGAVEGSAPLVVTFAEEATYIDFGAGNAPASLALAALSTSSYSPDNTAPVDLTTLLTVSDPNGAGDGTNPYGAGQIVDDSVVVGLAGDSGAVAADIGAGANQSPDETEMARDFAIGVELPARLKDDTYTLTASYTNPVDGDPSADLTASVTRSLSVENVAPVLGLAAPAVFAGTERIANVGTVAFTVDDYNAGALGGGDVTELSSLDLVVRAANAGACDGTVATQGLTVGFPTDGGADASGGSLDFSGVAFSAAIPVVASLSWATNALAGDYELCATLSDGTDEVADVLLATFSLAALNEGFHLTVDDGGDGLSAPGADPGESTTTEALSILFSGTTGAEELVLTVGQFQRSSGPLTFTASNLHGKLCLAATCVGPDLLAEADGVGGVVSFSGLAADALPGTELFVVFSFDVPLGTGSGNYAAPITVAGVEAL